MVRQLLTVTRLDPGAPSAERGRRARPSGPPRVGGAGSERVVQRRRPIKRLACDRRRRPARPGPVGAARQRPEVRRADADPGRDRARRGRRAGSGSRSPMAAPGVAEATGPGCSAASCAASGPPTRAVAWGSMSRASCAGRWTATSCSSRRRRRGRGVQRLPAGRAARRELSRNLAMPPRRRDEARPRPERRSGRSGSARRPCGPR